MKMRCWCVFVAVACCSVSVGAADVERALSLEKQTANKVFRQSVKPHWLPGNSRFWYRNDLADGGREFVIVDADKGTRLPAFDHQRLATAIEQATKKTVAATKLPIESLEFDDALSLVKFSAFGKRWSATLANYELKTLTGETAKADGTLSAFGEVQRSRQTGSETYVTFVNQTKADVQLFWITEAGEKRSYGRVAAGQRHQQHTFAGHAWLVTSRDGRELASFVAAEKPADALIDETLTIKAAKRTEAKPPRPTPPRDFSPNGKWRAFIKKDNVVLQPVGGGDETALTTHGDASDRFDGPVHWSPDSQYFAVWQTQPGDDRTIQLIESSPPNQLQPKLHTLSYAKPGDRVAQRRPRLFHVAETPRQIPVADTLIENSWSVSDLRWSADSRRFTFLFNQRGHQLLRVIAVDAATGESRTLIEEGSRTFVDYAHKVFCEFLDATNEVLWMSERDGWNHLYLFDGETGRVKNQITRGEWVVRGVERVDRERRQIWFRASGIHAHQDPYHVHLCRINFDGSELVTLTRSDGTHRWEFSPDARFLLATWSRVDHPPVSELRRADSGELVCELERADWSALLSTGWQPPQRFVAKGRDGTTDIFGILIRPTHFDPRKKYPVIEEIYAGPHGSFVPKDFGRQTRQRAIAELGAIVVQIDGMGTSHRSKAFHDVAWKNLGDSGFPDRIAWLRAAAAKHPELDLSRVGIYGGSAGGQSALRALLAHGDFYKVAVADCGCHDNRMDKIWWNELWMSWPIGPHYAEQSNVTQAHRLQGKLLLIVGELDRNVDPASTMQVAHALVKAAKPFELLVMPGTGHGAAETPYASRRRMEFLARHLIDTPASSAPSP